MIELPTPETDAEVILCHGIPYGFNPPERSYTSSKFARKLERERNEARHEINIIRNTLSKNGQAVGNGEHDFSIIEMVENLIQSKDYFIRKSDSLERERNEAREHLRAANKGAETNARINQSLANQIINANAMADKAKELIARWDQPSWKDTAPTAGFTTLCGTPLKPTRRGRDEY